MSDNNYLSQALALSEFTQFLRRDFHRHPELGFQEVRTAGVVARELNALGLKVTTGVGKTGVTAMLEGAYPGPVVMVRFDMDALPVTEETGAEYASQIPGVMHACGHDGHVAIGLTVARLLQARQAELAGSVKFVFQPAEEGLGGAAAMMSDGVLASPRPDFALGLHVWNEKPLGWLGIADGPVMAAAEIVRLKITGRGGHGALPNKTIDPVIAAAHIVTALQSIVSRNVSPLDTAVVSITTIHGGETFNVIPPAVELTGTIRTFDPVVRQRVLDRFCQVVEGVAASFECNAQIELIPLTPAVVNDPQVANRLRDAAARVFPQSEVETHYATMGSEDMACFLQEIPGCFIFIGSANAETGKNYAHHHPKFDFDEQVLSQAAALMAAAVSDFLKR